MEIAVEHVSKAFATTAALRDVSLTVRSGELMALLGPSGSGKTTLLRVIAGLEPADTGRVLFGARDATRLPVQQRRVGFVFQHYALFRHMSVARNIAYGLAVRPRRERPSAEAIAARVRELLTLVQLPGLEARYPNQLSGGQRQRVALARALAVDPQVLLLDEPFGALDAKVRRELRRWLRDIHERTGVTTIFVTHDQDEALELADRVAVLRDGTIEQVGSPDEIHEQPANAFVMQFIGDTSRIEVTEREGSLWRGDTRLPAGLPAERGGRLALFVRPWEMRLEPVGATETLPGILLSLRRTGVGRRADVKLVGSDDVVEVDVPSDAAFSADAPIAVRILGGRVFAV